MKAERIVLSIIAILIGLFVAGIVFYFFQMTMKKPQEKKQVISILPSPSPETKDSILTIDSPEDESVSANKTVKLTGKAPSGSTIVISLETGQDVVTVDQNGTFTDDLTLSDGVNMVNITAIRPDGKEDTKSMTLSYSTESY